MSLEALSKQLKSNSDHNQSINVLNFLHSLLDYKAGHSHSLAEQSIAQPYGNSLGLCVVGKRSLA